MFVLFKNELSKDIGFFFKFKMFAAKTKISILLKK